MRRFAVFLTVIVVVCSPVGPDPSDPEGLDPSDAPQLASVSPVVDEVRIEAGARVEFSVEATSPRAKALTITFLVDGDPRAIAPTFVFEPEAAGTFRVSAVVSDGDLETAHDWTVTVESPPNVTPGAVLSVEPGSGEAPLRARIRVEGDDPDGQVVRYRLELLGPTTLTLERVAPIDTVLTLGAGSWQATAIVEDDRGARAAVSRAIEVSTPNLPPVAELQVDPASGTAPLDAIVAAGGIDPDGEIVSYRLEVDGDFEIESASPILRSARFERAGTFWVRLSVIDDRGTEARDSVAVHVSERAPEPPPPPPPPSTNAAPTAGLVVTPAEGEAPLEVAAHATGTDTDGIVTAIRIDFDGDGQPDAAAQSASLDAPFRYQDAGTYTVRATAVDDDGAIAAAIATVTVLPPANQLPTGSLALSVTSGDAPLEVLVSADGSDPDGRIVTWEIEANEGDGFLALDASRAATLVYAFDEAVYRPRLRLTDDHGASVVIVGPAVAVYRPIAGGDGSVRGNPRFDDTGIAPAVWSDGEDRWRFSVTVRDMEGDPLPDVPLRVTANRASLAAPDGTSLGPGAALSPADLRTGSDGSAAGTLTTTLSTRIEPAPVIDFQPFSIRIEADAGHGQWREVALLGGLNANTAVSATTSRVVVHPANQAVCPGTPIEIEVRARSRPDGPSPGSPAGGWYTELRYTDGSVLAAAPRPGYGSWRTGEAGVIRFTYTPARVDQSKLVQAWVDGQPMRELAIIALEPASQCPS